ncbi:MAG TPA: hypothetical protein VGO21_05815, partial [Candidatus Paceibacterota bacterium]|nr:hypothetical protein [Candidatus Paceibacterota bacterium]
RKSLSDPKTPKLLTYALRNIVTIVRPVMAPFFDGPIENYYPRGHQPRLLCVDYDTKMTAWHRDAIPNHNVPPEIETFSDKGSLLKNLKLIFEGRLFSSNPDGAFFRPDYTIPDAYMECSYKGPENVIKQYDVHKESLP